MSSTERKYSFSTPPAGSPSEQESGPGAGHPLRPPCTVAEVAENFTETNGQEAKGSAEDVTQMRQHCGVYHFADKAVYD